MPHARERRLRVTNRFAIAGMMLRALAMMGTVFVIADVLFGSDYDASAAVGLIAAFFLYAWFVVAVRYRVRGD